MTDQLATDLRNLVDAAGSSENARYLCYKLSTYISLILTERCNLQCPYCYDRSRVNNTATKRNELPTEDLKRILIDAKRVGIEGVRLTGGEPFLKEGLLELLHECKGMCVVIATNGNLLKQWAHKLPTADIHYHFHTSLDGWNCHADYKTGSCSAQEILDNFSITREFIPDAEFSVNTVINRGNIDELDEMYEHLKDFGVDYWTLAFPVLSSELRKNYYAFPDFEDIILKIRDVLIRYFGDNKPFELSCNYIYKEELMNERGIRKKSLDGHPCLPACNAAKSLTIDAFGNFVDCLHMPPSQEVNARHYKPGKLLELARQSASAKFYSMKIADNVECSGCRYIQLCGGGCPYNSMLTSGHHDTPDLIACSLIHLAEKHIWPFLPKREQEKVAGYIDPRGSSPKTVLNNYSDFLGIIGSRQ